MSLRRPPAAVVAIALAVCASSLRAGVAIDLRYPREVFRVADVTEFVTNEPVLRVVGDVASDGVPWALRVTAPAGIPDLAGGHPTLTEVTFDLGAQAAVTDVLFTPVIERDQGSIRSFGVREFLLSGSPDGGAYGLETRVASGSGVGSVDGRATVALSPPLEARFVRLRWLSGWQRGEDGTPDVRLEDIRFVTQASSSVSAPVSEFAALVMNPTEMQPFAYDVLLHEGRNRVVLEVVEIGAAAGDATSFDSATVAVTLLPELPLSTDTADGEPTVLSDGASLAVTVPAGAAPETLRGLGLTRLNPTDMPVATYSANTDIDASYPPILAYEFSGWFQEPFQAVSTAALPGQPPSLAVDGRLEYPSTWVSNLAPFPIRWRVDLREEANVARVVIHPRVEDGMSFGPQRATVLFSLDNDVFTYAGEQEEFPDGVGTIAISNRTPARWVELVIEEGKQANDIQINEIEFFTATGSRVLAQVTADEVSFQAPVVVNARYFADDVAAANAPPSAPIGAFLWNAGALEWQWTRSTVTEAEQLNPAAQAGGGGLLAFDVNSLSKLALFVRSDAAEDTAIVAAWSFNPFSPNGDGIADTTRLSIRLGRHVGDADSEVTVRITDLRGMLVATPADGIVTTSSAVAIDWDGRDRNGRAVPIGAYIYEARVRRFGAGAPEVANGIIAVAK